MPPAAVHGSEYWTYTLPRRVGPDQAARLTTACLPVRPASALRSGLVDHVISGDAACFRAEVAALAEQLARGSGYPARLAAKAGHSVRVVQTEASLRFVGAASFEAITGAR